MFKKKMFVTYFFVVTCVMTSLITLAGEIGYIEDFSLADNREKALQQLIPGTEEFYYYQCLNLQNQGKYADVDKMFAKWIKRYGYTSLAKEIRNRQALFTYKTNPKKTLDYIRRELNLHFSHQREVMDKKVDYPTTLNQNLISFATLKKQAFHDYPKTVAGFKDAGLDYLTKADLTPDRRRDFLRRLQRPDYPGLPELIVADLKYKHSRGFGSMSIHKNLLLAQLDKCLELMPKLRNETKFVNTYLTKLHPAKAVDWQNDAKEKQAYLERMWQFVKTLDPVHNSLKANVLYQWLQFDREQGKYDKNRFMEYIKLPRNAFYIRVEYLKRPECRNYKANLDQNFKTWTLLPPIYDDYKLVRDYLQQFFVKAENWNEFAKYIRDNILKTNFAEAKILNGIGDQEKWYSMLKPSQYQALKERIDLDFLPTSKKIFGSDEAVSLNLYVKNIKKLFVKVYKINLLNYYKDKMKEPGLAISLEGLVTNNENIYNYEDVPLRRFKRKFDFPSLNKRGVYVVEFIGNGKTSRALINKGKLHFSSQVTAVGQVFNLYDDNNERITKGSIWLSGHEYTAEKDGIIVVPFTNKPGSQKIILTDGQFCSLDNFNHQAENYRLRAGIFVDRESLIKRKKAEVLVRPLLYINDTPVSHTVLENVKLMIKTKDLDGIESIKTVSDFKLFLDRESIYKFKVPENLQQISFHLEAKIRNLSQNKDVNLSTDPVSFNLNRIDQTDKIYELLLSRVEGNYFLSLVGKNGDPQPELPVQIDMQNRFFKRSIHAALKTDINGNVALGKLKEIRLLTARYGDGQSSQWFLLGDDRTYPGILSLISEIPAQIPYMGKNKQPEFTDISLLEYRSGTYYKNWLDKLKLKDGFIQLPALPVGNYSLLLKELNTQIKLRVEDGKQINDSLVSNLRISQISNMKSLQITEVRASKKQLVISVTNSNNMTRLHIFADKFQNGPSYSAFSHFDKFSFPDPDLSVWPATLSYYEAERNIGEEYAYIIKRKYAKKYPGNMLERPGLILNPFALRKTETARPSTPAPGALFADRAGGGRKGALKSYGGSARARRESDSFPTLDFLADISPVLVNLKPDKDGNVIVPIEKLGNRQDIHVIAVDFKNVVSRKITLPAKKIKYTDVRLVHNLDSSRHYIETRKISVLEPGERLTIKDFTTSKFEIYENLAKVYRLYNTLNESKNLSEFSFIVNWNELNDNEKLKKYSKYACHELNYFIFKKDSDFFKTVIVPYLENKKDKTFLDQWFTVKELDMFLKPWLYRNRLNVLEKILFAERIPNENSPTKRFVNEQFDMIPPDPERFNFLFDTAVRTSSLDTEGIGAQAGEKAEKMKEARYRRVSGKKLALVADEADALFDMEAPAEEIEMKEKNGKKDLRAKPRKRALAKKSKKKISPAGTTVAGYAFDADKVAELRSKTRQFYQQMDKTQELAENNYYKLPIAEQNSSLVKVNAFWNDLANNENEELFISANFAEASTNFTEIVLALASMDIPLKGKEPKTAFDETALTFTAMNPMAIFHREISPTSPSDEKAPLLVSQRYFKNNDRYRYVKNERFEKYVDDEFLINNVYGCRIVITNPTSSPRKIDVLMQIPKGAMPIQRGFYTKSLHWKLNAYSTKTFEYLFYFPRTGKFPHYPVQVASNEKLIAFCKANEMKAVEKLSRIDKTSWQYISQYGTAEEVIKYLKDHNLNRTNLAKIAFRMRDKKFFTWTLDLLYRIHGYNDVIWSYGIYHNDVKVIRDYLQKTSFSNYCGKYLESELLDIKPVLRRSYQFLEYSPLVNARTYQIGKKRKILNQALFNQYNQLLEILSYRGTFDNDDLMSITYYLLLQNRIERALKFFKRVKPEQLAEKIQYDYFNAYINFYKQNIDGAEQIADKYKEYPVVRWQNKFLEILNQVAEIRGEKTGTIDKDSREMKMTELAAKEPSLDFKIEGQKVMLNFNNIIDCQVNYYLMDIEFLFSKKPFVQNYGSQFSFVMPNKSAKKDLPLDKTSFNFELPEEYLNSNILVEISGGGKKTSRAYYANTMNVRLEENYGQIKVMEQVSENPLPTVYVKVYGRMKNGEVRFFKDGYTDLRGRFDYTSLNTNELDHVEKLSILLVSEKNGSVVKEAFPPKQ